MAQKRKLHILPNFNFCMTFANSSPHSRKYAMETLLQIYPEDIMSSVRSPEFLEKFSREEYQFGIFGLISSRITEYTKGCRWVNDKIPCNANFRPIITEEGKCFSFVISQNKYFPNFAHVLLMEFSIFRICSALTIYLHRGKFI